MITNRGTCSGLQATLRAAVASHDRGAHRPPETNQLGAALNVVEAQTGRHIEVLFGGRLKGWLVDLIDNH